MKKLGLVFQMILFSIIIFLTCECFQIYLYSFEDFINTSFYMQPGIEVDQMISDVKIKANEYNIDIFFIEKEVEGDFRENVYIYCDENVKNYLEDEYTIFEGVYNSTFLGSSEIKYFSWKDLTEEQIRATPNGYYLLGDLDTAKEFKTTLVDTYGGSVPKIGGRNSRLDILKTWMLISSMLCIVILFVTSYKVATIKKECFIRVTFGESLKQIIFKQWGVDTIGYIFSFIVSGVIIKNIYNIFFLQKYALIFLIGLIFINGIVYIPLLRISLKKSFSNENYSRKLLKSNYVVKVVLTILIAVSITSSIALIEKYVELSRQKSFYEERKEYVHVQLIDNHLFEEGEHKNLQGIFYQTFLEKMDIQMSFGFSEIKGHSCVTTNKEMYPLIIEKIPEFEEIADSFDLWIFVPFGAEIEECDIEWLMMGNSLFFEYEDKEVGIYYYDESLNWINYGVGDKGYNLATKPILLYNGREKWEIVDESQQGFGYQINSVFVKLDRDALQQFCKIYDCSFKTTNVYDEFLFTYHNIRRGFILNIVLLSFQFFVEFVLIWTLLMLEFEANRMELVIKKIMGYSVIERIGKLYLATLISGVVGVVGIAIVNVYMSLYYISYAYMAIGCVLLLELILISVKFIKLDKECIQKILKGGSVL